MREKERLAFPCLSDIFFVKPELYHELEFVVVVRSLSIKPYTTSLQV
jgi:hypothetical protein